MKGIGFERFLIVSIWEVRGKGLNKEKAQINAYLYFLEAPVGFEPTNKGFADLRLKPLGYSAL